MKPQVNLHVHITVDNLAQFDAALKIMQKREILVGVPQASGPRKSGKITNAQLALIHDKGSPSQNIPARPFMEPGIKSVSPQIEQKLLGVGQAVLDGDAVKAEQGMQAAGLIAQNGLRARINSNIAPALKPATLAARRRRGRTGTRTLIDTGSLRNSLTYVVKGK
jgi:phage gpG-like protein